MQLQQQSNKKRRINMLIPVIVIIVAIVLCYGIGLHRFQRKNYLEQEMVTLSGYTKEVTANVIRAEAFANEYARMTKQKYAIEMRISLINWLHMSLESLEQIAASGKADELFASTYVLDAQKNLVHSTGKIPYTLSDEELEQVVAQKFIRIGSNYYAADKYEGYYLVLACEAEESSFTDMDTELIKSVSYILLDNETGRIIDISNDEDAKLLSDIQLSELSGAPQKTIDDIRVYTLERGSKQYLVAAQNVPLVSGAITAVTLGDPDVALNSARFGAIAASSLILLFAACCLALILKLKCRRDAANEEAASGAAPATEHIPLRKLLIRSVAAFGIIILVTSALLHFMKSVMLIQAEIEMAFENLAALDESCEQNRELIYSKAETFCSELLLDVKEAMNYNFEEEWNDWLYEIARVMEAEEISVYDKDGVIIYSSGPYVGYHLSTNEADDEYRLWSLLNGGVKSVSFPATTEDCWYSAMRRTDDVGIILLKTDGSAIRPLIEKIEFADLLDEQFISETDRYYYMRNEPGTVYMLESGKGIVKTAVQMLPDVEKGQLATGMRKINGQTHFCANVGGEDWVVMYAYPMQSITFDVLLFAAIAAVMELIIAAITILGLVRKEPSGTATNHSAEYQEYIRERGELYHYFMPAIAIVSMLLLIRENSICYSGLGLWEFLINWETGLNFVSCTYILLAIALTLGFFQLVNLIELGVRKIMSPKRSTVFCLVSSIFKVAMAITLVIAVFERLGVKATAITASLGLSGLALGIGSKDVISDLVAGMFIIFEGKIQIGDFITVNGFTGEVKALNIRTTTVGYFNEQMIINNTALKNVKNVSRGDAKIMLYAVLPFDVDVDRLIDAVKGGEARFRKACDNVLLTAPVFDDITDYKDYGMECRIVAMCPNESYRKASRQLRTELKRVLDDNGIPLATKIIYCKDGSDSGKDGDIAIR